MSADRKTQVSKCARRVRGQWLLLFSCQVVFLLALTPWARAQSQSESQCPPISPTCGDGIVSMLDGEQCDDGNTRSNDGCNATCGNECGFSCTDTWAANCPADQDDSTVWGFRNSTCVPLYGDGKRVQGEECDDGNLDAGDGCLCTLKTRASPGGCRVESRRWICQTVADLAITCQSRTELADKCLCSTTPSQVELPAQPLKNIPLRTIATVSGFAGAAGGINCGSCSCHHYGECEAEQFCTWDGTCSGNGFCDGEGKCVCFGNFTGANCNRCKKDHYGAQCAQYCRFDTTCGGHGYCDFDGHCAWNPFCDGVDLSANACGDGRRLGAEECDDGNVRAGDGCSPSCEVEPGFVCTGGCQQKGDVRRLYGECGGDKCEPMPCGWTEMRSDGRIGGAGGVLEIRQPAFTVKSVAHNNPTLNAQNTLTITLAPNVPLLPCVNRTELSVVYEQAWLQAEREVTWCEETIITIGGLRGATVPPGVEPDANGDTFLPIWDGLFAAGTVPSERYGWGGVVGRGLWDDVAKTLQFKVLRTQFEGEPVSFQLEIQNAQTRQDPPPIFVGCRHGLQMDDQLMDGQLGAFQFDGVGSLPLALLPLGRRLWRSSSNPADPTGIADELQEDRRAGREEGGHGGSRGLLQVQEACPGGGGEERVCVAALDEPLPYASADTVLSVTLQASLALPPMSDVYVDHILPAREGVLFAVTSSTQCAQNLPYGPDDSQLYRSVLGQPARAYLSTANRHVLHSAWVQELYDGTELKMTIFWSFLAEPKTLKQRFRSAAEGSVEQVVWTVRDGQGVHRGTKRGVYRFSSKLAGLEGGFGVDGVFEGAGERFSQDDGVWGGGTGEVDGAIDEVYGGILEDFWGHGNFNQQDDATCQENACCSVYFMGGLMTAVRSSLITSKMSLLNCTACQCIGDAECTHSPEINVNHPYLLGTCGVHCADRSYASPCSSPEDRWFETFDGAVGLTVPPSGLAAGEVLDAAFRITNPPSRTGSTPQARVRVEGRADELASDMAVTGREEPGADELLPGSFLVKKVGQTSSVPGAQNTLSVTLRPSSPQPPGTRITISNLLPVPMLFAVTSHQGCSADLLPFGPEGPQNLQNTPYLSKAVGSNWAHSYFRQEVYVDGVHLFTALWRFLAPKTLRQRLEDASAVGEPVVWYFTPRGAEATRTNATVKEGVWNPPIPDLNAEQGAWAPTSVWGGASGIVNGVRLGSDFWGHADTAQPSTTCQQIYVEGRVIRPQFSIRSELYLEDTPLATYVGDFLASDPPATFRAGEFMSTGVGPVGVEGRFDLELAQESAGLAGGEEVVVNLTVMNRLDFRGPASAQIEVGQCNPVASEPMEGALGLRAPLAVVPPEFLVLAMGQVNPFPAAANTLSVTLMLNLDTTVFDDHRIELANLAGARRASGVVDIRDPTGRNAHLFFAAAPGGTQGQALWDEDAEVLALFLVPGPGGGSLRAEVEYRFEVDLENPAYGQLAPDVTGTALIGTTFQSIAQKDLTTDLSLSGIRGAVPGDAAALRVIRAQWAEGTRISQTSPFPGARNTLRIALNLNVALRSSSRSYSALVLTISGLEGASIMTSPDSVPLLPNVRPSSVPGSPSYFADAAGTASRGVWVQERAEIELTLARDTAPLAIYTFAFTVTNPVTGQSSPDVRISSSGVPVLRVNQSLCGVVGEDEAVTCPMPKINIPDEQPLFVYAPRFVNREMGQSTPYPATLNVLTITLALNVPIPAIVDTLDDGVSVVISNLARAVAGPGGGGKSELQIFGRILDGVAGADGSRSNDFFASSYQGAARTAEWDNDAKELRMWVVRNLPANTLLELSFELTNPVTGQFSPDIAVKGLGIPIEEVFVEKETAPPRFIPNALPGDAAPLRVYSPEFLVKSIGQTNPYPGALNSIRVTLRMSVDLPASSHPDLFTSWQLRISGLFGGPSVITDYELTDHTNNGGHLSFASSGNLSLPDRVGKVFWDGRVGEDEVELDDNKAAVLFVRETIERERDYTVSFSFNNPATPQQSPVVFIRTVGLGTLESKVEMDRDDMTVLTTSLCPYSQCWASAGDAMPLQVLTPRFVTRAIEQSNPFPGADNTITVTISFNVPLFPTVRNCSAIGYTTASRALRSTETGAGNTLCVGGLLAGSECNTDANCNDLTSDGPMTCSVGVCDEDRLTGIRVVLLGLTGPLTPNGPLDIIDATGRGGHLFFAASEGGTIGQGLWEQSVGVLSLAVAQKMEPAVNYSFSFTTTNPIAAQESPPVSIALAGGLSTAPVPMNRSVGDGAPVKVLTVRFLYTRVSQTNPYPFAVNTIHVTLATNLPLTPSTKLTLYPFKDATMDADVPGYNAAARTIQLTDPSGQGNEALFGGSAEWQGANKAVVLSLVTTAPQQTNMSISFNLRNPGSGQSSTRIWVAFSLVGSSFQATELQRDFSTDLRPAIPEAVPGHAAPIRVYSPFWTTVVIGQRSPYPNRDNTLTITLRPAYPIPARARATITISGLLGAIAPAGRISLRSLGGVRCSEVGASPGQECTSFAAALTSAGAGVDVGFGQWDPVRRSIVVALPSGMQAGVDSLLSFEILNPPRFQAAPIILVELGGSAPIPRRPLIHDLSTDLGNPIGIGGCGGGRWVYQGETGDAAALRIFQGHFLCFGAGCGGGEGAICLEGAPCNGRIGQRSAFPGSDNTITVTFASNVPISADPPSQIVISGLLNAINIEGGDSIAVLSEVDGQATDSAECLFPTAQPLRFASLRASAGGVAGRAGWSTSQVAGGTSVSLTLHLLESSLPNVKYKLSFNIRNPIPPQNSPETFIQVLGTPILRGSLVPAPQLGAPMLVLIPEFFIREIRQETAIPSAENVMNVELASNTPLFAGACITLSGFTNAIRISDEGTPLSSGGFRLPLRGPNATLFASAPGGEPGFGLWRQGGEGGAASLELTLVRTTEQGEAYAFSFGVTNPALQQSAQPVMVQAACGVVIEPALFRTGAVTQYQPMRVLAMTIQVRNIGQANDYPGAVNMITVTLAMNLDLSTVLEVVLTMSGLRNSQTESTPRLGLHCKHTGCCGDRRLSTSCLVEGCCKDMHGTIGTMCGMADRRPTCGTLQGVGQCATNAFGERIAGANDTTLGSSSGEWDQEEGTLKVVAVQKLTGNQQYTFSFDLVNPLVDQGSPPIFIEASSSGNEFIPPIRMIADPANPPFRIAPPSLLLAKAAQSTAFPCSSNTIAVTLALNIPLRPGIFSALSGQSGGLAPVGSAGLTISGLRGATCPSCQAGIECDTSCAVPLLTSPSNLEGASAFTAIFDTLTETLTLLVRPDTDLAVGHTAFVAAGEPFEVRFELINNKEGQNPSQLGVQSVGVNDWLGAGVELKPLQTIQVRNCSQASAVDEQPMLVHAPRFTAARIAQSTPYPLHHNLITVTFSTNVPLRVRCLPVITMSGFKGASGALVDLRTPGPAGTQWRSDSCPSPERSALRVSAMLEGQSVDDWFGFAGPDPDLRYGRGRAALAGSSSAGCGGQGGGLLDCQNRRMCFGIDGGVIGLEGDVAEWREAEGVMTWFRGQQDRAPAYARPAEMPGLGDGTCDAAWNCVEYGFDEGDCAGTVEGGLPQHRGTVAWVQEREEVVAHVLADTEHAKEYVLSFQLTNAATYQHSADLLLELTGIRIAPLPLQPPEEFNARCNTGGVAMGEDDNPLNVYSASLLTYDISDSTNLPGVQNTITVSLQTNVHIYPRANQFITIIGLAGTSAVSGPLKLSSDSTHHSFFQAYTSGPRGYGLWDNAAKELAVLVSSDLLPSITYSFSFTLTNPPTGQAAPTILIGGTEPTCPPSARPLSTRVPVRLKTSEGVDADGNYPELEGVLPTFTITSFEDGTRLIECHTTLVEEESELRRNGHLMNMTELWMPAGQWYVSLALQGETREDTSYFPDTLEFDSYLVRHPDGAAEIDFVEGVACGSIPQRTFFQSCTWQPRIPGGMDVVLHPRQVGVTRLVLTWGDMPRDLDLYVTFTSGGFEPYLPQVSCPAGRVIRGGGVWYGCRDWIEWPPGVDTPPAREALSMTGEFQNLPRVKLERMDDQGGRAGGELVTLRNVDSATVQVYVNSRGGQSFAGMEQLRVLYALREGEDPRNPREPSEERVYTSVLSSVAGTWWHVGVLQMGSSSSNFQVLNYDKLFEDPLTYVFGYKLYLRVTCKSGRSGRVLRGVNYALTYVRDRSTLLEGIVPDALLSFPSPNYNTSGTISTMDFTVALEVDGFAPRTFPVRYQGRDMVSVDVFMVPQDEIIRIFASWTAPIKDAKLWVFPCTDSGRWTIEDQATTCPDGPILPGASAVHEGCSQYTQQGRSVVHSLGEAGGLQMVQINAGAGFASSGTYDIFVHIPADAEATDVAGQVKLEVIAMQGLDYVVEEAVATQVVVDVGGGGKWWHVGYMLLDGSSLPQLNTLNFFGSSPTGSGCRIPSRSVPMVTRTFDPTLTTVIDLISGVSVLIPPNEWPPDVDPTVTVMQLELAPAGAGAQTRVSGPPIYLEPSGVQFLGIGARITMPLTIIAGEAEGQVVHRLESGVWVRVPSVTVGNNVQGTTPRFSAYQSFIVSVPPPPPPPDANFTLNDDDQVLVEDEGIGSVLMVALVAAFVSLITACIVAAVFYYRLKKGRFPWQKEPLAPTPKENMPIKSKEVNDMRTSIYKQEVASRQKHSAEKDLNEVALDIQRELDDNQVAVGETREAAALVPAMAGAQRDLVESSLRVHGPAQPPRITNGSTQPPEAISQLVRAGILVPNRASIKGGNGVEGDGAPSKLEIEGHLVEANIMQQSKASAASRPQGGDTQDELEPEWQAPDAGKMGPTTLTMSSARGMSRLDEEDQAANGNGNGNGKGNGNGHGLEEAGWGSQQGIPFLMDMHKSMHSFIAGGASSGNGNGANGAARGQSSMQSNGARRKPRASGPSASFS